MQSVSLDSWSLCFSRAISASGFIWGLPIRPPVRSRSAPVGGLHVAADHLPHPAAHAACSMEQVAADQCADQCHHGLVRSGCFTDEGSLRPKHHITLGKSYAFQLAALATFPLMS